MPCTGLYALNVCVKSPHSLVPRSFGFLTQTSRAYNPVRRTFYTINYISLTDCSRALRITQPSQFWGRWKYFAKHTLSYTTTRTTLSRFDSSLNILFAFFPIFCSQDPPLDLQSPGKEGGKGESVIASNKGLIWRKLGTFCCPFSPLAASDAAKASANGDNSGVVQSFTNPHAFK